MFSNKFLFSKYVLSMQCEDDILYNMSISIDSFNEISAESVYYDFIYKYSFACCMLW